MGLDHGIQTDTVEFTVRTRELLRCSHLRGKVYLLLRRVVVERAAGVESFVVVLRKHAAEMQCARNDWHDESHGGLIIVKEGVR